MALLKQPPTAPVYRAGRAHGDFVVGLEGRVPGGRGALLDGFAAAATSAGFDLVPTALDEALELLDVDHHRSTAVVEDC
jgi:hypothetical protein